MTSSSLLPVLRRARELVASGWTQHVYARDAMGAEVDETLPAACRFCVRGAIYRAEFELAGNQVICPSPAAKALLKHAPDGIVPFNDAPGRTQAEVIALFDRAIASLEATR